MTIYEVTFRLSNSDSTSYSQRYEKILSLKECQYKDETTSTLIYKSDKGIDDFTQYIIETCNLLKTDTLLIVSIGTILEYSIRKYYNGQIQKETITLL